VAGFEINHKWSGQLNYLGLDMGAVKGLFIYLFNTMFPPPPPRALIFFLNCGKFLKQ
jgi:hypothetical protein